MMLIGLNVTGAYSVLNCRSATLLQAVDRKTSRPVMIKAFAKHNMAVTKREKLDREVQLLKLAAACPGVVKYLNSVEDSTHLYTVLEHVPGMHMQFRV